MTSRRPRSVRRKRADSEWMPRHGFATNCVLRGLIGRATAVLSPEVTSLRDLRRGGPSVAALLSRATAPARLVRPRILKMRLVQTLAVTALMLAVASCAQLPAPDPYPALPARATAHPEFWPRAASPAAMSDAGTEAFITGLMSRMTLEEKVGQLIQADISSIKPEDLATYPLGSILAWGNSSPGGDERAAPQKWLDLARAFRAAAAARPGASVPLIYGIDAVHGHNNVVGATIFPHNIGLGAARDPDLIRRIAEATAMEVAVTGADWTFGPTLAVPRDDRWGRSYEGFSEDP